MLNELLLIGSVALIYGAVLLAYLTFGKSGLYVICALTTVFANIEVLLVVKAFGMEQTLGNVMFAANFLITDILSENEGKKSASKAVWLGVFSSLVMLVFTQYTLLYTASQSMENMKIADALNTIFSRTPRLLIGSFAGYAVSQRFDVWLYHRIWKTTESKCGDKARFLWLRNNAATLISQILNTVIFTVAAFAGIYETKTLLSIMLSSYIVYIFTSLLDTPVVYLARKMNKKGRTDLFKITAKNA